jgi:hypothetical protein
MECPISMTRFQYPVVLPCGHTFDKGSVIRFKKKICPMCRVPYLEDVHDLPVNWVLVEIMGLDVETSKASVLDRIHTNNIKYRIMNEMVNIVQRIYMANKRGRRHLYYDYASGVSGLSEPDILNVRDHLKHQLDALGYKVTCIERVRTCLCLIWVVRYVIIEWKKDEIGSKRYIPIFHRG